MSGQGKRGSWWWGWRAHLATLDDNLAFSVDILTWGRMLQSSKEHLKFWKWSISRHVNICKLFQTMSEKTQLWSYERWGCNHLQPDSTTDKTWDETNKNTKHHLHSIYGVKRSGIAEKHLPNDAVLFTPHRQQSKWSVARMMIQQNKLQYISINILYWHR